LKDDLSAVDVIAEAKVPEGKPPRTLADRNILELLDVVRTAVVTV
jgi:hypothetical protein